MCEMLSSEQPSWMACAETIKENNAVTPWFVFHLFFVLGNIQRYGMGGFQCWTEIFPLKSEVRSSTFPTDIWIIASNIPILNFNFKVKIWIIGQTRSDSYFGSGPTLGRHSLPPPPPRRCFCPITALALPGYDFFIGRAREALPPQREGRGRKGVNLQPLFAAGKRKEGRGNCARAFRVTIQNEATCYRFFFASVVSE